MTYKLGGTLKMVGGLALTALLLAACGNDTVVTSPTTAAATTAAATTTAPIVAATTVPATTVSGAAATAAGVATAGAAVQATPGTTPNSGTTPTPSPIAGIGTPGGTATTGGTPGALTAANTTATQTAQGDLKDASGNTLGRVFLAQGDTGVKVVLTYNGLPAGDHGIHFHAVGKCEGPDFASAGAHFNPENKKHGLLSANGPHAGDMPDLIVPVSQTGIYEATSTLFTLGNGPDQLIGQFGAALVVHAKADDQLTDPTGNSGDRIACAVLTSNASTVKPGPGTTPGTTTTPGATPANGTPGAGATVTPGATRTTGTPGATGTPGTPRTGTPGATTTAGGTPGATTAGTAVGTAGSTPTPTR